MAFRRRIETVLVVDDEVAWLRAVKRCLGDRHVVSTSDPAVASKLARDEHPELALVDLRLGLASGLDVLRALKADRHDLVVVLMSCHLDAATAVVAIRAGADEALEKTVDVKQIVDAVELGQWPVEAVVTAVPTAHQIEHGHIAKIVAACGGNQAEAARRLGMPRATIRRKLSKSPI